MNVFLARLLDYSDVTLLYQFFGTLLLGWALTRTPAHELKEMSDSYSDLHSTLLRSLINQRTDAQFGVALLLGGTAMEIAEKIFDIHELIHEGYLALFFSVLLLFALIAYFPLRKIIAGKIVHHYQVEAEHRAHQPHAHYHYHHHRDH